MEFRATAYGSQVAEVLALEEDGYRLMPLSGGTCSSVEAANALRGPALLESLAVARKPKESVAGLWLYFSCLEESHHISQSANSPEGAFWHGIMHRQEPDFWNAKYWFRQVGLHPIFGDLQRDAAEIVARAGASVKVPAHWDPAWFVDFCEQVGNTSHPLHRIALEIQRAEWQLLFDYCAKPAA